MANDGLLSRLGDRPIEIKVQDAGLVSIAPQLSGFVATYKRGLTQKLLDLVFSKADQPLGIEGRGGRFFPEVGGRRAGPILRLDRCRPIVLSGMRGCAALRRSTAAKKGQQTCCCGKGGDQSPIGVRRIAPSPALVRICASRRNENRFRATCAPVRHEGVRADPNRGSVVPGWPLAPPDLARNRDRPARPAVRRRPHSAAPFPLSVPQLARRHGFHRYRHSRCQ